ncbi:DUF2877 domain-containing protein [Paenibacillus tepidiphilus]|uniref:oxamate carbamoyltransferase subunit AllH family protein n=1 Tax=Paenibacillus tepidiphilus TaxID=2608683 RepID=UPI0013A5695A|nr:DUF2877 domain-containing protein [Paenibacillus tepidiphilus]
MSEGSLVLQATEREEGIRLPSAAGGRWAGAYIHSVYKSTINIAGKDGQLLLSLAVRPAILAPGMAILDWEGDFTGLFSPHKPCNQIRIVGSSLQLSEWLICDLSAARLVSLAIPGPMAAAPPERLAELTEALRRFGKPGGAGRPWLRAAGWPAPLETLHERALYSQLMKLALLARSGGERELYGALTGFAGLGIGLTPSADDFITGFFGIMLAARPECRQWAEHCGAGWLARVQARTTFLGYEMLRQALAGKVNRAALAVITACLEGDGRRLEAAACGLAALGSTSGTDMLAGIAFGLDTLYVWKRRESNADQNCHSEERLP